MSKLEKWLHRIAIVAVAAAEIISEVIKNWSN
jgi:hypothetical protein